MENIENHLEKASWNHSWIPVIQIIASIIPHGKYCKINSLCSILKTVLFRLSTARLFYWPTTAWAPACCLISSGRILDRVHVTLNKEVHNNSNRQPRLQSKAWRQLIQSPECLSQMQTPRFRISGLWGEDQGSRLLTSTPDESSASGLKRFWSRLSASQWSPTGNRKCCFFLPLKIYMKDRITERAGETNSFHMLTPLPKWL